MNREPEQQKTRGDDVMANNRLYLKCKCGKMLYMGRHFQDGWHIPPWNENSKKGFAEVLNAFYDEHFDCFYEYGDHHLYLATENDE